MQIERLKEKACTLKSYHLNNHQDRREEHRNWIHLGQKMSETIRNPLKSTPVGWTWAAEAPMLCSSAQRQLLQSLKHSTVTFCGAPNGFPMAFSIAPGAIFDYFIIFQHPRPGPSTLTVAKA